MEEQLLPLPALEPAYEKVVWLYVYRDFSGSVEDRAAERIALRMGYSSYPQHHLVHPESFQRLTSTGRSVESFLGAVERTKLSIGSTSDAPSALARAERIAGELEEKPSPTRALTLLRDEDETDVVVAYRAAAIVADEAPDELAALSDRLLALPHDPLRYLVLDALGGTGDVAAAPALESIAAEPADSLNPNVLRIRAVKALAACGRAESVPVLAPFAEAADWRNGLTRTALDALMAIAEREKDARKPVRAVLARSFPAPPAADLDEAVRARTERGIVSLAKHVHGLLTDLTGKRVKFPPDYDEAGRSKLVKAFE